VLRRLNTLDELVPPAPGEASGDGILELAFDLPMPGVSGLELVPSGGAATGSGETRPRSG